MLALIAQSQGGGTSNETVGLLIGALMVVAGGIGKYISSRADREEHRVDVRLDANVGSLAGGWAALDAAKSATIKELDDRRKADMQELREEFDLKLHDQEERCARQLEDNEVNCQRMLEAQRVSFTRRMRAMELRVANHIGIPATDDPETPIPTDPEGL